MSDTGAVAQETMNNMKQMAEWLLKTLEAIFSKDPTLMDEKVMKVISNHIKRGGAMDYKIVPNQYKDEMIKLLKQKHVPYICLPNTDTPPNYLFMIRNVNRDRMTFLEAQKTIFTNSTEMYMETSVDNMLNSAKFKGQKQMVVTSFGNDSMMQVAKNQLLQNGVVFAATHNGVGGHIIINEDSLFSPDGKDMANVELQYALRQARLEPQEVRIGGVVHNFNEINIGKYTKEASEYDNNVRHTFAVNIKQGKPCILGSAGDFNKRCVNGKYLEATLDKNGDIMVTVHDKGKIGNSLRIDPKASVASIEALISKNAADIYDMKVQSHKKFMSETEFIKNERPVKGNYAPGSFGLIYTATEDKLKDSIEELSHIAGNEVLQELKAKGENAKYDSSQLYKMKKERIADYIEVQKAELSDFVQKSELFAPRSTSKQPPVDKSLLPPEIKNNVFTDFIIECHSKQMDLGDAFSWVDIVEKNFNDTSDRDRNGMVVENLKFDKQLEKNLLEEAYKDIRNIEIPLPELDETRGM